MKFYKVTMKKLLSLLLALMMVFSILPRLTLGAHAATPDVLYLKPSSNWMQESARFAAYFFNNSAGKYTWVGMTDSNGDDIYEVEVPDGFPNVIFCRMNPADPANDWNNKWNQTGDLTVPTDGKNLFTIPSDAWDYCNNTNWGTYTPPAAPVEHTWTVAGTAELCGTAWDTANTANNLTKQDDGTYVKVFENVPAGDYKFKVVRDYTWDIAYPTQDKTFDVTEDGSTVTITFDPETKVVEAVVTPCDHSGNTNEDDDNCTTPVTCSVCDGIVVAAADHTPGADATCIAAQTCTVCGMELAAATGEHTYENGACTGCGEEDPNADASVSGSCGDGVTWTLDSDGVLTISGVGDMSNYNLTNSKAPWCDYSSSLKKVVIESGVTRIGHNAFNGFNALTEMQLPATLTVIGNNAICNCPNLSYVEFWGTVRPEKFGNGVFSHCDNLVCVYVPTTYEDDYFARTLSISKTLVVETVTPTTYTITWLVDGEEYAKTENLAEGDTITAPADPTKAAVDCTTYTFIGWDVEIPETMPAEDLIFNARFTEQTAHIPSYTDNEDGTHRASCASCGQNLLANEPHNYVDGACADCGAAKPAEEIYAPADGFYIVGNGEGNWLNDIIWDAAAPDNKMQLLIDGVYEITFTDVESSDGYQFKIVADGTWSHNWGAAGDEPLVAGAQTEGIYNGVYNYRLVVDNDHSTVTIRIDLRHTFDPTTDPILLVAIITGCDHPAHSQAGICSSCGETVSHSYNTSTGLCSCGLAESWTTLTLDASAVAETYDYTAYSTLGTTDYYYELTDEDGDGIYTCQIPTAFYENFAFFIVDGAETKNYLNTITLFGANTSGNYLRATGEYDSYGYLTLVNTPAEETPDEETITFYFINSGNWSVVNAYAWREDVAPHSPWPGTLMNNTDTTAKGFDVYALTIPTTYDKVIFNNNSGLQTDDLVIHAGEYFDFATDTWHATLDDYLDTPDIPAEPTQTMTIYFQNNWLWTDVSIYYWGSSAENPEWPGYPMTLHGNDGTYDIYAYEVPVDVTAIIISGLKDDGSGNRDQTPDITGDWYDGICYYMMWNNGNVTGSADISDILPSPEPGCDHPAHSQAGICTSCGETVSHSYDEQTGLCSCGLAESWTTLTLDASAVAETYDYTAYSALGTTVYRYALTDDDGDGIYTCQVPTVFYEGYAFFIVDGAESSDYLNSGVYFGANASGNYLRATGEYDSYGYLTLVNTPAEETPDEETITFYFINSGNWSVVNAYAWLDNPTFLSPWPGTLMNKTDTTAKGFDVYALTIPTTYDKVIFNNNSGLQTGDLVIHAGEYFDFATDTWYATLDDYLATPDIPAEPTQTMTIYFQNNWLWTDVSIYYWGSSAENPEWPGYPMTLHGNDGTYDIYAYEVPVDVTAIVINGIKDDGSGYRDQTPDITGDWYDGICYYMMWNDGNVTGSADISDILPPEYALFGIINGADYGRGEDSATIGDYLFVNGTLTATFTANSYVAVKTTDNAIWYMTDGWQANANSATLYDSTILMDRADLLLVPGGVEVTFTLVENADGTLTLSYRTPSDEPPVFEIEKMRTELNNSLQADFAILSSLRADWTGCYAVITQDCMDGTRSTTVSFDAWGTDGDYLVIPYAGLAAKEMTDDITVVIYDADHNAISEPYTSSLADYAVRAFAIATTDEAKALYVELLYYGAAAQAEFGYRTDTPATDKLTDAMSAIVRTPAQLPTDSAAADTLNYSGARLQLENNIKLDVNFSVTYDAAYTAVATCGEKTMTVSIAAKDDGTTIVTVEDLVMADCSEDVTVQLYNGEELIASATDSAAKWAARTQTQKDLAQAIVDFAAAAKAYLQSK